MAHTKKQPRSLTRISASPIHGRGMFATTTIRRGVVLEKGHVLPFDDEQARDAQIVDLYAFDFDGKGRCLVLGSASLCNHSDTPNVEVEIDETRSTYRLIAVRRIEHGEELFVDYGDAYWESVNDPAR
jgi:SET domain-containing protein